MREKFSGRWLGFWAFICLAGATICGAVEVGWARVNVLGELGRPVSAVTRGNTEVLTYKDGVKITLKDGKVTEIVGLKPAEPAPGGEATAPAEDAPAAEGTAKAEAKEEKEEMEPEEPKLTKEQLEEQAKLEKQWADEAAKGRAEMEKALTDLENLHSKPAGPPEPPRFSIMDFIIGLVLKWLLTLAALKLTCKYWGCEIFWSGLMTVAAVDVAVRMVVGLIIMLALQMPTAFYADEAAGAVAMVLVLRKVSINQSLAQAVQVTITSKVFSVVVGSFLLVVLMHALH